MRVSESDYALPDEAIAQTPAEPRDSSRMLILDRCTGEIEHARFRDLPKHLEPGDLVVMNDARVTALRLHGRKPAGARVEALLLREVTPGVYAALVKPGRRLKKGARIMFREGLEAEVIGKTEDGGRVLRFNPADNLPSKLKRIGSTPLPPYFKGELDDPERYQTVYASAPGSSAAPTAGLHFTPELLRTLHERGVETAMVSLEVGLDTFRPIPAGNVEEHKMHGENYCVPMETAQKVASARGRVVAVGTTTVRALESAAAGTRRVEPGSGNTDLFIRPSYNFRVVDGIITNFHLPRTTMLLLVAAFCGGARLKAAYREALQAGYRFLSFGDSMLILAREQNAKD
ncbi:MAG: tRNA preQ1(34) S-adenosylmethionine ribosyltransferase-isomerase QueA [Armatimonadetes bacterium]|nr:tRNA preQ1(34) S-adenosylmethionine ribosyltransferase-isomerase QueA [Armatimonadota bacterium]